MTFILNVITPRFALQISDRRLTWATDPPTVKEDDQNKAVLVEGRVALGYTGLATVDGSPTDQWLAKTISAVGSSDFAKICEALRAEATSAFLKVPVDARLRRHAFQGVGWLRLPDREQLTPAILTVSNALDGAGDWLAEARPAFETSVTLSDKLKDGFLVNHVGVTPTPSERKEIWRLLRRCARRDASAGTYMRAMVLGVRGLARRYPMIGRGLLGISIPRVAVEETSTTGRVIAVFGGTDTCRSFLYFPFAGEGGVQHGPHLVMRGSLVMNPTVEYLQKGSGGRE